MSAPEGGAPATPVQKRPADATATAVQMDDAPSPSPLKRSRDENLSQDPAKSGSAPDDEALLAALRELLSAEDHDSLTMKMIRKRLESQFGCSLKARRDLLKAEVERIVAAPDEPGNDGASTPAKAKSTPAKAKSTPAKAKSTPSSPAPKPSGAALVGQWVKVLWSIESGGSSWEVGEVKAFDAARGRHRIVYDDGTDEWQDLAEEQWAVADEDEEEEGEEEGEGGGSGGSSRWSNRFGRILSAEMQEFLGEKEMDRRMIVKAIWKYVKERDLQDPKNRRKIILDEKLGKVFKGTATGRLDMFAMNKQLSR